MKFTESHRESLLASMHEEFAGAAVTLGDVYPARLTDANWVYVDFFVDGKRHLADVSVHADGSVDWAY